MSFRHNTPVDGRWLHNRIPTIANIYPWFHVRSGNLRERLMLIAALYL